MWRNILGHDRVLEQFGRAISRGRLASTFLFVGPEGIGKKAFALQLAQVLLCKNRDSDALEPCDQCDACKQFRAGTHPDLHVVSLPKGKSEIPLDLLIGDKEHRMRAGLCYEISLKPFMGGRKIAIIDDADNFNDEGANSLLKTLEEPPAKSVIILIGTSLDRILPTIRSRCQIIRFEPLSAANVTKILQEKQLVENPEQAERLGKISEGSLTRAQELADPELWKYRDQLLATLTKLPVQSVSLAKELAEFIDSAGKEAILRRNRLKWLIGCVATYYRDLAEALSGVPIDVDADSAKFVKLAMMQTTWKVDSLIEVVEQSLEAIMQIDMYVNQNLQIEAWLERISQILTPPVLAAQR
jgi:DNA polymerase-3 subunit delta'